MKTCYFTGLLPSEFPFDHSDEGAHAHILYTEALYQKAEALIRRGYTAFLTELSPGADLDFACAVIYHKEETFRNLFDVSLEVITSVPEKSTDWTGKEAQKYDYVLSNCDRKTVISSESGSALCENRAYPYAIAHADLIFVIWNGEETGDTWNTVCYARQKRKPLEILTPGHFLK